MSFQARLMLTVTLCLGIILGWNALFPPKRPDPGAEDGKARAEETGDESEGETGGAAGSPDVKTHGEPSPIKVH